MENTRGTSLFENGLIWFGAGLSIAEILTGTAFAPMIAIQIADYFILKSDKSSKKADITNAVIWVIGFILYRYLMTVDIPVGNTLPDMAITIVIAVAAGKIINGGHTAK